MSKEIIIIRHGRSKYNVGDSEDLDSGLTDFGHVQTENTAKFIAEGGLSYGGFSFNDEYGSVFVSPFLRTLQTAKYLKDYIPALKVFVDIGVGEYVNHTTYDTLLIKSRQAEFPDFLWDGFKSENCFLLGHDDAWFLDKIHRFYNRLPDKSIVVSHGLPCMTLVEIATKGPINHIPLWDFSIGNSSITWIKNNRAIWLGRDLFHEIDDVSKFNTGVK